MQKISVVMIVYNGEKYLSEVLKSAKKIADEIIIVIDARTTDKTAKIAKEFGAKTYIQKWLGYGKQKNFVVNKTKNNWVFSLDYDEVLDNKLIDDIKHKNLSGHNGFYVARKNLFGKKWVRGCGWYPDWQLRLYRKDKLFFEEKEVHETVKHRGKIGNLSGNLVHYTYENDKDYFIKLARYTDLDAKILYNKRKKWSISYQFGKPLKEFWQKYIKEKGYLDGALGFKICLFSAYYRWTAIKKLNKLYKH